MKTTEERLQEIICDQLGVEKSKLLPETKLCEDLGGDSLDAVELVMFVEEEFGLDLSEPSTEVELEKIKTYGEALAFLKAQPGVC